MEKKIPTSVVVPVYNEADFLKKCLAALMGQESAEFGKDYEVIVVDDGSTDASVSIARNYPVRLVQFSENKGKIRAREAGAQAANFSHILFVDARVEVGRDILRRCWEIGYSPLLSGRQLDLENKDMDPAERLFFLIRRAYYYPNFPLTPRNKALTIDTHNFTRAPKGTTCLFIRKDLFLEAIPKTYDKYSNDDSALLEYIVFQKKVNLVRHYDVAITYAHRTQPAQLSRWVVRRGVTFFDFYLRKSALRSIFFIFMPLLVAGAVLTFSFLYSMKIFAFFLFAALLAYIFLMLFLIQSPRDIPLVFFGCAKYAACFYFGMAKGWVVRRRSGLRR